MNDDSRSANDAPNEPTPSCPASSCLEPAAESTSFGEPLRWSIPIRSALVFAGIVLPVVCFAITFPDQPDWQSGELQAYAQLLLSRMPTLAFYPLLLYSMTSMGLLVFSSQRYQQHLLVRVGIYTGVVLALQYTLLFAAALVGSEFIAVLMAQPIVALIYISIILAIWFGIRTLLHHGYVLLTVLLIALSGLGIAFAVEQIVGLIFLGALYCATFWALLAYGWVTIVLIRRQGGLQRQFSLRLLLGLFVWAAVYFGSWRLSILWMLRQYAQLPTSPPHDCYVCTAAARGHRRLVGTTIHRTATGKRFAVNDQMRYLKAAELVLRHLSPTCHRPLRATYDHLGPRLAVALCHPLLADVAYMALKPAEWTARLALVVVLGKQRNIVCRLYEG